MCSAPATTDLGPAVANNFRFRKSPAAQTSRLNQVARRWLPQGLCPDQCALELANILDDVHAKVDEEEGVDQPLDGLLVLGEPRHIGSEWLKMARPLALSNQSHLGPRAKRPGCRSRPGPSKRLIESVCASMTARGSVGYWFSSCGAIQAHRY